MRRYRAYGAWVIMCAACGTPAPSDSVPPSWMCEPPRPDGAPHARGGTATLLAARHTCPSCTRELLPMVESGVPMQWWR